MPGPVSDPSIFADFSSPREIFFGAKPRQALLNEPLFIGLPSRPLTVLAYLSELWRWQRRFGVHGEPVETRRHFGTLSARKRGD